MDVRSPELQFVLSSQEVSNREPQTTFIPVKIVLHEVVDDGPGLTYKPSARAFAKSPPMKGAFVNEVIEGTPFGVAGVIRALLTPDMVEKINTPILSGIRVISLDLEFKPGAKGAEDVPLEIRRQIVFSRLVID